jgi:hypothetical protein
VVLVSALALSACSDSESSSKPASGASSTAAPATPGRPIVELSLSGDGGLAGAVSDLSVRCDFPDLNGESIAVLGKAYDSVTQVRVAVLAGNVTVQLFGSGPDGAFAERDFEGTGVNGFDVAKGASIDSPLTETAPKTKGATAGSVGAITSIKGTVDCNGQDPGTSGLTLTGDIAEGALSSAKLDHARVECNRDAAGDEVVVLGLLAIGSTKAFVSVGLRAGGIGIVETLDSGVQRRYQAPPGSATATSTGGHADGDAVEQDVTPPHTIHVEGDVTCGTPTTG